jgi:hypothetical protein
MQPGIHEQVDPLRRTDWRFLLPNPLDRPIERLVLLGGPDDLPDLVERSGIAERVSRELPSEAVADAVVLLGASLASLRRAAHGVAPGGSLYAEFDRRSPATCADSPGRVRRALARAGLAPTGTYWIRPDLVRRQVYVPVQSAGPLAWYLRSLFTASSPPERVLEAVLRRLERLGPRAFAACAPCFAVTAVAGPGVGSSPSVVCHDSLPPEARSAGAQILVITQGKEDFKRVTVLPFPASGDQPLVVLKSARSLRHNECTRSEQEILGAIRSALDGAMRASVPEPLGFVQRGHVSVGIESVAPGRSMVSQVNYWGSSLERRIDELRRVAAWLTEFHRRVQLDGASWGEPEQSQWIDGPLADYERAFGAWTGEQKLFAEARRRARALLGVALPTVWVHWDFSEYNVHTSEHGIHVIDWERATPGPPLLDLLFFATTWSHSARSLNTHAARLGAFRRLFGRPQPDDPVSDAAREVFARYQDALDIDRRFFPVLLVAMCAKRALIHLHRRGGAPEPTENARRGNQYLDWIAILAEDVEGLFRGA